MIRRSRFRWTLAVALAAHGWLAWELRDRHACEVDSARARPMELEIAIEAPPLSVTERSIPVTPEARETSEPRATPTAPRHEPSRSQALAVAAQVAPSASSAPEALTAPPLETTNDGAWTFSPTRATSGDALPTGLARPGERGVREARAEDEKKATAQAPPILFTPQDFATGLVPGGQFVSMARDNVRRSLVPDISRALLEFDTNSKGVVVTVRVLEVTADRAGWDDVAAALAVEASTGRPERVPPGVSGLAVVLEVKSTLRTGSGAKPADGALESIWRGLNNPADIALERQPTIRVVAARIVDVHAL